MLLILMVVLAACQPAAPAESSIPTPPITNLILATTTSTQDSGLLDVLLPVFEAQTGYKVQTIAVGTGQALKMGEEGNADVLLVHAPSSEIVFMDKGFGRERFLVMHNDFVIIGPGNDPAGIRGVATAAEAFRAIYDRSAMFISRGDDSGTHKKELDVWKSAELDPAGFPSSWYLQTGQGMGPSLIVASEKQAYILTDRGTYLASRDNVQLDILVEGDKILLNMYHVITVNPDKYPAVNYDGALAFAKFMTNADTQQMIAEFGVDKYGQPLFFPDAQSQ